MWRCGVRALLFAALAGIPIALAAPASANPILHPVGSPGDRSVANVRVDVSTIDDRYAYAVSDDMPTLICARLRAGYGETRLVSAAEESLPHLVAQVTVYSSEFHFCPEFY
jgi:hypothetical protein